MAKVTSEIGDSQKAGEHLMYDTVLRVQAKSNRVSSLSVHSVNQRQIRLARYAPAVQTNQFLEQSQPLKAVHERGREAR